MENFRILICLIPFGILCHSAPQFDNLNQGQHCDDEREGAIDLSFQRAYEQSITDFTQEFLAVAWKEMGLKNFVFSPHNMHSSIAMLNSGASDNSTTQDELLASLGHAGNIESLKQLNGKFVKSYKGTEVEKNLKLGNRIWTAPKYFPKIDEGYKSTIGYFFGSEFAKLSARNPEKEVNDWVKEVTDGKTNKIIDILSPETSFLIVNTLLFKASWTESFSEGRPQEFRKMRGSRVIIPMMTRNSKKQVIAKFTTDLVAGLTDRCTALAIPYEVPDGKGTKGRFEFVIVMPEHHRGLQFFQSKAEELVAENFGEDNIIELALEALESKRDRPVNYIVNMPEFKIDTNIEATELLRKLYIDAPFDDGEFDRIIKDDSFKVSGVKHSTTFEVTKEGTFGAAASSTESSPFTTRRPPLDINKPFLFFVHDTELDVIILAGIYAGPDE